MQQACAGYVLDNIWRGRVFLPRSTVMAICQLYYGIVVMETHRFAFITMGCRYNFIQVSPHNSTTELKFHLSNQNSLSKLKWNPLSKTQWAHPIQQYKHCIFK